jgi:ribosomal protein S21
MINIEVEKNSNESNASLIRRFTKKVQGSGILPRVKSIRYSKRDLSSYKTKMKTLESIKRKAEIMELIKMGKMTAIVPGQRRGKEKPVKK